MDSYGVSAMSSNEALDFTAAAMKKSTEKIVEPPVLDLSCKKSEPRSHPENSSSYVLSPISCEDLSNSPTMDDPKQQSCRANVIPDYSDDERKSPFEGRTFMVTPPSETDSPRKQKYETVYDRQTIGNDAIGITDLTDNRRSSLPMIHPSSLVVPAGLPNLSIHENNNQTIDATMMQLAVSTSSSTSSICHELASPMTSPEMSKKAPRPFKAYPKDPLSLTIGTPEMMYDPNSNEAYSEFRKRMLDSVRRTNEGTNIKMRRVTKSPGLPTSTMDDKDAAYWERRRKNNEAAKRSRDARRAKEDEIAIRAAFLEQENMKLKYELVALRNETAKLRCMVYTN